MINLHQLIYALSDALDLVGVDDIYHGKRVAFMALECAKELNISEERAIDLFHSALLHDCGVSSTKVHDKLVSGLEWEGTEDHCIRGFQLLKLSQKLQHLSSIVLYHHTHWEILKELNIHKETAQLANLIFLVDRVDALCAQNIKKNENESLLTISYKIREKITQLSGTFFDPKLVEAFLKVSQKEVFWFTLEEENLHRYFENFIDCIDNTDVSLESLKEIAKLFAFFVDVKSSFTADHSMDVSKLSEFIAKKMNLSDEICTKMGIAGLLHDLGKLRVPDEILDKTSRLTKNEFDIVKIHAYETHQILSKVNGIEDIARWAAQHHETLKGTGYPYHSSEGEIPLPSRIIAIADIFQALAQKRPYRNNLKPLQILKILKNKVKNKELDEKVLKVVETNLQSCWEISLSHSSREIFTQVPKEKSINRNLYMGKQAKEFKKKIREITIDLDKEKLKNTNDNVIYCI